MLSVLISSKHSYSAVHLAVQLIHQRFVQFGPLVLESSPLKHLTPAIDRDRTVSRRSEPSSRATLMGEQPTLGTFSSPRMWRADIEVPNLPVDVSSWGRLACYPRSTFYPMSDGPSIRNHRITMSCFAPDRLVGLTVKHPYAITLYARLPSVLRVPLKASVTLLEATTPVKLPTTQCPSERS